MEFLANEKADNEKGNGQRVAFVEDTWVRGDSAICKAAESSLPEGKAELAACIALRTTAGPPSYPLRVVHAATGETLGVRVQGVILDKHLAAAGGTG